MEKYIEDFLNAAYDGYGALAASSFNEKDALITATQRIAALEAERDQLRTQLEEARAPIRKKHQPCGCQVCHCQGTQCLGCGAHKCNTPECVFLDPGQERVEYVNEPSYAQLRAELTQAQAEIIALRARPLAATCHGELDVRWQKLVAEWDQTRRELTQAQAENGELRKALRACAEAWDAPIVNGWTSKVEDAIQEAERLGKEAAK